MEHLADVRNELHETTDRLSERLAQVEVANTADSVAVSLSGRRRAAEFQQLWNWVYVAIALGTLNLVLALPAFLAVFGILFKHWLRP
jgi:hypothetical protein